MTKRRGASTATIRKRSLEWNITVYTKNINVSYSRCDIQATSLTSAVMLISPKSNPSQMLVTILCRICKHLRHLLIPPYLLALKQHCQTVKQECFAGVAFRDGIDYANSPCGEIDYKSNRLKVSDVTQISRWK